MFDLTGRVVVVSGASSGLGAQMAEGFAAQGADLIITARRLDRLEALADKIRGMGPQMPAAALRCNRSRHGGGNCQKSRRGIWEN